MSQQRSILRSVGSLWFAGVLLMLALVSMAAATVFESTHGTEHALAAFYKAWWFQILLALVGLNVLAAMIVRYPFSRRQTGFVITHTSIIVILIGAWITERFGLDGQIALSEGQATRDCRVEADTLTLSRGPDGAAASVGLPAAVFSGFEPVESPSAPALSHDGIQVRIARYLPDSTDAERIVDDNPHPRPAVEVSLAPEGVQEAVWLFGDQTQNLGPIPASYRQITDAEEFKRWVSGEAGGTTDGRIQVELGGTTASFPLADCLARPMALGETGYSVRALRYMPHAIVGPDKQMQNASNKPVNPAVELEITGPEGAQKQLAFARFPDFKSMHPGQGTEDIKITFVASSDSSPAAPLEVLAGPGGALYVRFAPANASPVAHPLTLGTPIPSPWSDLKFCVLRRFENARSERVVEAVQPVRQERQPAILVEIETAEHRNEMWLQKNLQYPVTVNGTPYTLTFGDQIVPLGFALKLDRFQVGYYPGVRRPRSFESHVTIEDAASGRSQSRVVSMNHPASFAGYTFYQSSYRQEGGRSVSFLSVARDPGQPIVFSGYIGLMGGMVLVLITKIRERRRVSQLRAKAEADAEIVVQRPSAGRLGPGPGGNGRSRDRDRVLTRSPLHVESE